MKLDLAKELLDSDIAETGAIQACKSVLFWPIVITAVVGLVVGAVASYYITKEINA